MTYSNGLKSVVSDYGTTDEVAPRKPSIKNYSVFGNPSQKIGNFTQTKLGCF